MTAQQIEFPLRVAVCAWCEPVRAGARLGELSHGICLRHLRKLKLELHPGRRPNPKGGSRRRRTPRDEALLPF